MSQDEMRLYGPPGTGKTTWVAKKAGEYAEKYGGDQVSLCSLTNTAVREVVGRNIPIPTKNISTLHARCKRAMFAGAPAESDVAEFAEVHPEWAGTTGPVPRLPKHMLRKVKDKSTQNENLLAGNQVSLFEHAQILRQKLIPRDKWPVPIRRFSDAWEGWCRDTGRMDFTGWLEAALESRILPPQKVVFVDEAQDHTPLQLAVIRSWETDKLIMVGDDDQCCYEWSGSVPDEFFQSQENLTGEKVLEQSYRVPEAVWTIANKMVQRISSRKEKVYKPRPFKGSVHRLRYTFEDAFYDGILPDGFLENPDETYMIIGSCGYMVNGIIDALKAQCIPFHNPYRTSMARWNPLRPFMRCIETFCISDRLWTGREAIIWADTLRA